eukprot:Plantae.Rhodophyta-Purpureofilum_apyrenoidigerum.ctg23194.p1 GENE.Plantae.Rhodophyta-Purpureofilum_apyrenoidigerum.ctg23194~~Plantae.Rhodophyta-Purpureofilum_apyrenoidigerum.ctg23194.p1  ORF type:complete len:425 (+),score=61.15 Plantae.Rhodophyta-Purpureofilum_apyrenoidigerum.ctg23194:156-1430(+)
MPTRIGKYRLGDTIALGTYSEIKLCVNDVTDECHAVKIIKRESLGDLDNEKEISREVKILSELRHSNIVSVHDVLMSESKCYIVMELVRGGDLSDRVKKGRRLPENEAREIFVQIAEAVAYCHQKGIYHRDIKLENVLLAEDGRVKLTDFGLGCISQESVLHTQCGTPMYIAPEVIMKAKHGYSGEKIDVWECGVLLYACLVGLMPFRGVDNQAIFRQIVFDPIDMPEEIPAAARDLLSHMLNRNAERRWTMSDVLQHPWCKGVSTSPEFERTANAINQISYNTILMKEKKSPFRPRSASDIRTSPSEGPKSKGHNDMLDDGPNPPKRAHSDVSTADVDSQRQTVGKGDQYKKRPSVGPLEIISTKAIGNALKSIASPRAHAKDMATESCYADVRSPSQRRQKAIIDKSSKTVKQVMHILHRKT